MARLKICLEDEAGGRQVLALNHGENGVLWVALPALACGYYTLFAEVEDIVPQGTAGGCAAVGLSAENAGTRLRMNGLTTHLYSLRRSGTGASGILPIY